MKKSILFLFAILEFFLCLNGQTTFDKAFFSNDGNCNSIIKTLDSKFLISGTEGAFPNGKVCLMKIDSLGSIIWKNKYDFGANAYNSFVQQSSDSSYFLYGQLGGAGAVGGVAKFDKNGVFIWGKRFLNVTDQSVTAGLTIDNGKVLIGHGVGEGYGLTKYDASGNVIWSKTNTSNTTNSVAQIIMSSDGNYVFTGQAYSGSSYKATVTKVDTSGNVLWSKQFSDISIAAGLDVCQTTDGGYALLVGGNCLFEIIKLDGNGNMVWSKYSPITGCSDIPMDIVALSGNRILLFGGTLVSGFREIRLYEIDASGTNYIARKISNATSTYQVDNNIVKNKDGTLLPGPIMLAYSSTSGSAAYNIRRLKPDYSGCGVVTLASGTLSLSAITQQSGVGIISSTRSSSNLSAPTVTTPPFPLQLYCSLTPLSVSSTQTNLLCNGVCNGSATAIPSGGQSPYTYSWSGGGTSATKTAMCAGTYTCTVTDALSATASVVVTITQPTLITLSTNASIPTICSGSCTNLNATSNGGTGTHTYGWMPGSLTGATVNVCPTSTTTYTCTVTDGNSCTKTSTVTVTVNTIPATPGTISGTATICSGTTNTYSVTAVSGATSYTWTLPGGWTGTSTTNSISATANSTSGNITVTANNSCGSSSATSLAITVNTSPSTPGTISGITTICSGTTNTYSVGTVSGATSYTWTLPGGWTGTSTTNSISVTAGSSSGNITVAANNSCGSSTVSSLAIVVDSAPTTPGTISGTAAICSGTSNTYSITAVSGATSYTWTLPSGWAGSSSTTSINSIANSSSGNVSVTASNGCGSSTASTLSITVNSIPAIPNAISGTTTVCSGTNNTYSIAAVAGATSYVWTLPGGWTGTSTTNSISATASATSGNITVSANNSCGNSSAASLAISVNSIPSTPGAITGSNAVCIGSSNTYSISSVVGATTYTWILPSGWSGASTSNIINTISSGTSGNVIVVANNSCGTSSSSNLAVTVNSLPTVTYSQNPDTVCFNDASFALSGGTPPGGIYSGTGVTAGNFDPSISGTGTFTITYTFTDTNSCTSTATENILVDACLSMTKQIYPEEIQVYPSPTNGLFTLYVPNIKADATATIYNTLGEVILIQKVNTVNNLFDLSEFENGIYFIQLKSENRIIVKKIIKE